MQNMLLALVIAFAITAVIIPKLIPILRRLKFGQSILEDGPTWHKKKQGIPTMGGIAFICGTSIACLVFVRSGRAWLAILTALSFGLIGFVDDYIKVVKKRNKGLSARQKSAMQIFVALAFLLALKLSGALSTVIWVPFFNVSFDLSWGFYPFAIFAIVGCVNAVNLTDGLDGLASCVTLPVFLFFGAASFVLGSQDLGIFASALAGSLFGFLLFNYHPAKIFMGDTGSLYLGGAVCTLAFCYNIPLILVLVGLIYMIEALSDIIQVFYYKATKKRFFKMAPIHHHFELCGWSEEKVGGVFSAITVLMCMLAFWALLLRYTL